MISFLFFVCVPFPNYFSLWIYHSNDYYIASIGVDRAENELAEVGFSCIRSRPIGTQHASRLVVTRRALHSDSSEGPDP